MINRVALKNTATYDSAGVEFRDFRKINYVYGENGSGKTTFSNLIADSSGYPECEISWKNNVELKALVYNKKFVDDNFHQHARLKGIFTLGKESHDIKENIREKTERLTKLADDLANLNHSLEQNVQGRKANETDYEEKCWRLKLKYDGDFSEAFKGYRSIRSKFKEKCKSESINTGKLLEYEELKALTEQVFLSTSDKISLLPNKIDVDEVISAVNDSIFAERIIGKEDIDIAKLITELNISDWVRQGYSHLKMTNGICPFCQQATEEGFERKLAAYFDETFNNKMQRLHESTKTYVNVIDNVLSLIGGVLADGNEFVDSARLMGLKEQLNRIHESNLLKMSQKTNEPSRSLILNSVDAEITAINELIDFANVKTAEHNDLVENIETEKSNLISSVWRFISNENKADHKSYVETDFRFEKAIEGIKSGIRSKSEAKGILEEEVTELERQISSIRPSIDEMNALLKSFSFTNFKFAEAEEKGDYRIIRYSGEDAKETLSEGEKTFVAFLYFIQLLNGSTDTSRINEDKIIVIDDPISSLDSNVLFIVSTLIRRIVDGIRTGDGHIKQVFILTHNIHFHKEVSFNKGKGTGRLGDETFWVLRKVNNVSRVENYDFNPVKTSYHLLWQDLRQPDRRSSTTVQNIMRRIIESYFKNFGGYTEDDIISKFEGEEQVTCRALVSWINDGSHFINDDLYMESGLDTIQKYLFVFENIFSVMGHGAHYKMMMDAAS